MFRCRSAFVVSTTTNTLSTKSLVIAGSTATTATALNTIRRYEYPAVGITWRSPTHTRGEQIPSTYEPSQVANRDADARMMTGNADSVVYDAETMYDPHADVAKISKKYSFLRGHQKYAVGPVTDKQLTIAKDLFEKCDKDAVWKAVLKDYPSLATPLDYETKKQIMSLFEEGIAACADEEAVFKLCRPVIETLLEKKFISQPYWWRFQEKLVEQMCVPGVSDGKFHDRVANIVTERFTKLLYNSWNDLPWASDEYTSPIFTDVCGARQCTEAGMW